MAQGLESWTGLVAVFDLPDPWPNAGLGFPDVFAVQVEYQGMPTAESRPLSVLGGVPMAFSVSADPSSLQLQPMLRLRPAWNGATGEGFDPSWTVTGLEFTLRYTPGAGDVSSLQALGNGEAAGGLATATELVPQGSDNLWRVLLMDPSGFQLPDFGCAPSGDCFAGRWSLLDFPLEADDTGVPNGSPVFEPTDFSVEDLRVVGPNGMELAAALPGETFFHAYTASNVAPLPEPGALLGLAAGCLGLGVVVFEAR